MQTACTCVRAERRGRYATLFLVMLSYQTSHAYARGCGVSNNSRLSLCARIYKTTLGCRHVAQRIFRWQTTQFSPSQRRDGNVHSSGKLCESRQTVHRFLSLPLSLSLSPGITIVRPGGQDGTCDGTTSSFGYGKKLYVTRPENRPLET